MASEKLSSVVLVVIMLSSVFALSVTPSALAQDVSEQIDTTTEHSNNVPESTDEQQPTDDTETDSKLVAESEVTLVTGETVQVTKYDDGYEYSILDAHGEYKTIENGGTFYLIPEAADLSVYDRELFNVTRLVENEYYSTDTGETPVIIQYDDKETFDNEITTAGVDVTGEFELIDASAGTVSGSDPLTPAVVEEASITDITLDYTVETQLDESADAVAAEAARDEFDVTGSGINISVIDSGIDSDHPDLADRVIIEQNFNPDEDDTLDVRNHGTPVAGVAAGNGTASDGEFVGVAPESNIFDMRALDSEGSGPLSAVLDAIEESVNNDADIVSMSLGAPIGPDNPLTDAVDSAVDQGTVVISSAGNSGSRFRTITSPANAPSAIAVGADDTIDRFYDEDVAAFSSRGPTEDFEIKPAVTAPGVFITTASSGDAPDAPFPYIEDGISGTSFSAPHVSGIAALILEQNPEFTQEDVRSALVTTATRLDTDAGASGGEGADVYTAGAGQATADRALDPDLFVDTPQIGFEFEPIEDFGEEKSESFSVENLQDEPVNLSITGTLEHVTEDAEGNFTLNRSSVEVGPQENAGFELTVNASANTDGLYSGYLTLSNNVTDESHTVIFGYEQPVDLDDAIAITKNTIDNRSVEGEGVNIADPDGDDTRLGIRGGLDFNEDGVAFWTPDQDLEANYTILSTGRLENPPERDSDPVMVSKIVEQPDPAEIDTIELDETEAVEYGFGTSSVEEERGELLNRQVSAETAIPRDFILGDYFSVSLTSIGVGLNHTGTALFAGPAPGEFGPLDDQPIGQGLNVLKVQNETFEPLPTGGIDSDRVYNLVTATNGVDRNFTEEVTEDELRQLENTYRPDDPEIAFQPPDPPLGETSVFSVFDSLQANTAWDAGSASRTTFSSEIGDRVEQTYFHTADNAVWNFRFNADYEDTIYDGIEYNIEMSEAVEPDPDIQEHVFNEYPTFPSVDDEFGTLINDANIFQDGFLHSTNINDPDDPRAVERRFDNSDSRYTVLKNDEVLETEEDIGEDYTVFVQEEEAEYDLSDGDLIEILLESEGLGPLHGEMETRYAVEFDADEENEPPELQAINMPDINENNSLVAGADTQVIVDVIDHVTGDPAEFNAFVSGTAETTPFDEDAEAWEEATEVTNMGDGSFSATLDVPTEADSLSMAFEIVDDEGSETQITMFDAIKTVEVTEGAVTGQVTDQDGFTVGNVTIEAEDDSGDVATTATDEDGTYRLDLEPGPHFVRPVDAPDGFDVEEVVEIELGAFSTQDFEIEADLPVINGTVVDSESEEPITGATVSSPDGTFEGTTDADGVFSIGPTGELERGETVAVRADAPGFEQSTLEFVDLEPGENTVSFALTADERTVQTYAQIGDSENIVETEGLRMAIDDWRGGEIDTELLRSVIDAWRSADPVE